MNSRYYDDPLSPEERPIDFFLGLVVKASLPNSLFIFPVCCWWLPCQEGSRFMGNHRSLRIRPMTAADIPFGVRLSAQNRWNQLDGDWRRQLALEPDGSFLAELDGQPVGTACSCVFDDVAWISLVLVDQENRGRGIGMALMRHVVKYLDERGLSSVRLDATPMGQPIYEKLGFVGQFMLARYQGVLPATIQEVRGIEPLTPEDMRAVSRLDEAVTQTRREKLLRLLYEASPDTMRKFVSNGRLEGYCLGRPGSNAWQIGPIQGPPEGGRQLLLDVANRFQGQRVYLDVPTDHAASVALTEALGLTVQRLLLRMCRGRPVQENLTLFWSSFGPEKG